MATTILHRSEVSGNGHHATRVRSTIETLQEQEDAYWSAQCRRVNGSTWLRALTLLHRDRSLGFLRVAPITWNDNDSIASLDRLLKANIALFEATALAHGIKPAPVPRVRVRPRTTE